MGRRSADWRRQKQLTGSGGCSTVSTYDAGPRPAVPTREKVSSTEAPVPDFLYLDIVLSAGTGDVPTRPNRSIDLLRLLEM